MNEFELYVEDDYKNMRLDVFLSESLKISRSLAASVVNDEEILVNGKKKKAGYKLDVNDVITGAYSFTPTEIELIPQDIPINIFYEDEDVIVVNKDKGMVVHPAPGHYENTLVNALLYHCNNLSGINGVLRPGIVHRLDKDTSGLLVVAKNDVSHSKLSEQLSERTLKRIYNAVAINNIKEDAITIDAPIGRHPIDRKKMCVTSKNSRNAVTHIRVLERFGAKTLIEAKLETGRTHQIRVHMAYRGNPILGDVVYGKNGSGLKGIGQVLHAKTLGFVHPSKNEYMEFDSELPKYFEDVLEKIRSGR